MNRMKKISLLTAMLLSALLAGCSDDDNDSSADRSYEVSVVNLTAAQPLSPIAIIAHNNDYQPVSVGSTASIGLEILAEGGDNAMLLDEANAAGAYAVLSDSGAIGPSATTSLTVTLTADQSADAQLSIVSMLVNTNDAFTRINTGMLQNMLVGDVVLFDGLSYDSGTEANSESAGTIPGPADGGTGYSSTRDDIADQVSLHSGVITVDDGLSSSVLTQVHRWDNPVMRVSVTRTE